jgi:hypothetical protein
MTKLYYTKVGTLADQDGHPYNARGYPGDTTELQKQIDEDGQRSPMRVTQPNAKGVHLVTCGHRRKAAIDALRQDAKREVKRWRESNAPEAAAQVQHWTLQVERFNHYIVDVTDIRADDIEAIISDMDAGIINEPVNVVALGEAMMYRIDRLHWTFTRCAKSLGLSDHRAKLCLRAADPAQTAESVRKALRSGELSLNMFATKLSRLDRLTQDKVLNEASKRASESKRGHGIVNTETLKAVIEEITGENKPEEPPDAPVLGLLAMAREQITTALALRGQWSPLTEQMALYHLDEIAGLLHLAMQEGTREASA